MGGSGSGVSEKKHLKELENKNRIIVEGGSEGQGKVCPFLSNGGYYS